MTLFEISRLTEEQVQQKGILEWPVWEKEVSCFPWYYDETEDCYILEGDIFIETAEGVIRVGPGDFVTFHKGLECKWDIRQPVRKHYHFR